ncbi:MAG: CPBP family intramembrane metalloprotease [Chloroflexi bacterium]|nr:CPBP family intramembrane metalloprotease [Chloroflexota bacterium]
MPPPDKPPGFLLVLATAGGLVAYGNLSMLFLAAPIRDVTHLALLALVLAMGRAQGLDMGFSTRRWGRALAAGLGVGAAMALPALLFFAFPVILTGPVEYPRIARLSEADLAYLLLVRLLVGTAALEETAFRGLLQSALTTRYGWPRGIILTTVAFALWHVVVLYQTVGETNVGTGILPWWMPFLLGFLPVAAAGLVWSSLRLRTGSLIAPIASHWTVVGLMDLALYLQPRLGPVPGFSF